jgi:hypothetical protein
VLNVKGLGQPFINDIPSSALAHATFSHFLLADSLSAAGDNINAGVAFLKVDPYYFIRNGQTPKNIDTFLAALSLTSLVKQDYKARFMEVWNKPKSGAYETFRAMFYEDQEVRTKLGYSVDSASITFFEKKEMATDTAHFAYLHAYVQKNGWPSIENGSLYAWIIAVHDHQHLDYYMPIIKKAVLDGAVPIEAYKTIGNKRASWREGFEHQLLNAKNKAVIDLSCLFQYTLPDQVILKIQKAVNAHCPITYEALVYESNDKKDLDSWKVKAELSEGHPLDKLTNAIWRGKCTSTDKTFYYHHIFKDGPRKTIKLYLLY